ncbi:MAG: hypothetical protein GX418_11815 [Clostridiales bacterium]|nr:hypothetical protein [Clostridiales bacterium]
MSLEIPNPGAMLETVIRQEEMLRFERFAFDDAWRLGLLLRERVLDHGGDAAMDITVGGVQLFRCGAGVPTPNNGRWIRRKANVVLENWKSSLRVMLEMTLKGRTPEEFGLRTEEFALSGGSFPLWVKGQGVIGAATVSGLPQTHDHQMVADALAAYLDIGDAPSVLA